VVFAKFKVLLAVSIASFIAATLLAPPPLFALMTDDAGRTGLSAAEVIRAIGENFYVPALVLALAALAMGILQQLLL